MSMCDPAKDFGDYLVNFEFIKAPTCTYSDPAGLLVVGLLVFGAIALTSYIETGTVIIPFVLLLTTGGAVLTMVAAPGIGIATILLLVTGAGAMTYLYYRYSR